MKYLISLFFGTFFLLNSTICFGIDHNYTDYNNLLKKYVASSGSVSYGKWKGTNADYKRLTSFKAELEKVSVKEFGTFNHGQQKAYLINAYNALTILLILDNYPLKSIKKIGGVLQKPWSIKFFNLLELSLIHI